MTTYNKLLEDKDEKIDSEEESSMSFLDHLDELRKRLTRIAGFVFLAFIICWVFSDKIYNFLQVPVLKAKQNAQLKTAEVFKDIPVQPLADIPDGTELSFSLPKDSNISGVLVAQGTTALVKVQRDAKGAVELALARSWLINANTVVQEGYVIPTGLYDAKNTYLGRDNQLVTNTVQGAFNLYIKVAFFASIFFAVPFILVQAWGFIAPGLYPHEKKYAAPLIIMASLCFITGCAFAYYIAFPRAADFLLSVATEGNIQPLITVDEYFDLILTIMLGLGVVFEIPAIVFFLARMGLVTHKLLLKVWRVAVIVIFIIAAILSPTTDVPNLMVFAAPMMLLYAISVGIAWVFHRDRKKDDD
jgi:sec-independent protein translocase protein TatC